MAIQDDEILKAVAITGRFENSGDPWTGVTGDFDGMGLSCGVLQWNIGSATLQPMILAVGEAIVRQAMPSLGAQMWRAVGLSVVQALPVVRSWQNGTVLKTVARRELVALMATPQMRAQQFERIRAIAAKADGLASEWATARGGAAATFHEFVWFFDLVTQNGGLKGLTLADVRSFLAVNATDRADDVICDWLLAAPTDWWGRPDCLKNAARWRNKIPEDTLDLFVLSYLRAARASTRARGIVMNRKGTLAIGAGYVNGGLFDLSAPAA